MAPGTAVLGAARASLVVALGAEAVVALVKALQCRNCSE